MVTESDVSIEQQRIHSKCYHPTGTYLEFPGEALAGSISDRFEEIVRTYPNNLAVKDQASALTYAELNRAANLVANEILSNLGHEPEPVAFLFNLGVPNIIAMMGILKSGKFYVPLDPSYPLSRNAAMLEDSCSQLIVTNSENVALAAHLAQDQCKVLNIDESEPTPQSTENPSVEISPNALAYLIYTSGSTGRPKGVIESHRNVLHEIMLQTNWTHTGSEDRQSLIRSTCFQGSIKDVLGSLLNGASLHPLPLDQEGLPKLPRWLIEEKITLYRSVASVFRNFASNLTGDEQFPDLRLIYVGGEPVYTQDIQLYKNHFSDACIFINGMGITETGTVRQFLVDKHNDTAEGIVPVGYPVEDKEILLLDESGEEVGENEVGEIAIKSDYLSPGYWKDPELTRAKFLLDPGNEDGRIYLTGDMGRMLPDGCLVHLGRKDSQVKIRGHRVEIAEVKIKLAELGSFRDVAVAVRDDGHGDPQLVAYLVPAGSLTPTIGSIRRALSEELPQYMIPSAFVMLDSLPQLPNGKLDIQALSSYD